MYPNATGTYYGGSFLKERNRFLSPYFTSIYVIRPVPVGKYFFLNYTHDGNVHVFFPMFFHLPLESLRRRLGFRYFTLIDSIVVRNNWNVDIIHAHTVYPSGLAGILMGKKYKKPVVLTVHGSDIHTFPFQGKWQRKVTEVTLRSADAIIAVSTYLKDIIINELELKDLRNKIFVIPNGVDTEKFRIMNRVEARKQLELPLNRKIVLNVANLVPVKNQEILIREFAKVVEEIPDSILYIVGKGPLKRKLENVIEAENLQGKVILVGARPHDEIPLWMNASDVFVLPSKNEGFPTVVVEALATGTPVVISSNVRAATDVIINKLNGYIVEGEEYSSYIVKSFFKEWNRSIIRKGVAKFSWDNWRENIEQVYLSLGGI